MNLPTFTEFSENLDFEKLEYDMERLSPPELKKPSSLFSEEQYAFICQTIVTMNLAMLQQYHQWLAEQFA